MTLTVAIAMILPMTVIHLFEVFTVLYPAPMVALITAIKAAALALVALL
jgi:hypothetical protein